MFYPHRFFLAPLLLIALLGPAFSSRAQGPAWRWAAATESVSGAASTTIVRQITADSAGNGYVAGFFTGTTRFGATTLIATPGVAQQLFVAKLSASGAWQWAATAPSTNQDEVTGLAVTGQGMVYVTGYFSSTTLTLGSTTLTNVGARDLFVAQLNPAGQWQWAQAAGGSGEEGGIGLAIDAGGDLRLCGSFASPQLAFGATAITSTGGNDGFVARLTGSGQWQWAHAIGGRGYDFATAIAVDATGALYVAGAFASPTLTLANTTLTNADSLATDAYVARFSAGGQAAWVTGLHGSSADELRSIGTDGRGNVYVAGNFLSASVVFGPITLQNASPGGLGGFLTADVLTARLDAAGQVQWARASGGRGDEFGTGLTIDGAGDIYVSGGFTGDSASFGVDVIRNAQSGGGGYDAFATKLTPQGNWVWAKGFGGVGQELNARIAGNARGDVYFTGSFDSPALVFGSTTLTNPTSNPACFVAALSVTLGLPADAALPGLLLAPNPAAITVHLTGAPAGEVRLLDAVGRTVQTIRVGAGQTTAAFSVEGLPAGLYLVRAGGQTRRLVVAR